ncbi:hypothetical protein K469DRAFT_748012 [Zopfia rhizophila CBS 207.26]|uniref:MULE transposase domain-containing protein n=1 Tax=Zopfia rhizophila CBS 207.26 TaxID=1314779 RepID=A0A6A6EBV7_9PEZI|nr:hypothetical protein K469DRAFT_750747 [Zopfia rhizophila CBS 207.26]KAF2185374.1 hypothetical protein K469DRAFT_750487 [Zopfia rhizophila CBS 207.26]KAF2189331.1 hypothetical protein K469DRAFT_748012 [Zopfia rhizophila CBS 207.26]
MSTHIYTKCVSPPRSSEILVLSYSEYIPNIFLIDVSDQAIAPTVVPPRESQPALVPVPEVQPWIDNDFDDSTLDSPLSTEVPPTIVESVEEEVEELEPEGPEVIIFNDTQPDVESNSQPITATRVIYVPDLPEYPRTSTRGIAYIVSTHNKTEQDIRTDLKTKLQYSKKQLWQVAGRKPKTRCAFFNDIRCHRIVYECTGCLCCEYLDPEIRNLSHSAITPEISSVLRRHRVKNEGETGESIANSFFLHTRTQFAQQKACGNAASSSCRPLLTPQQSVQMPSGAEVWQVRCIHRAAHGAPHKLRKLPANLQPHIQFLLARFAEDWQPDRLDTCHVVDATSARRHTCGVDHLQGEGALKSFSEHFPTLGPCPNRFQVFIPVNLCDFPYYLVVFHNIHNHPPPPPVKTPQQYIDGIISIINNIRNPNLTLNTFIVNPRVQEFCSQFGGKDLWEVHQSLANMDRISAIIYKQRMLHAAAGQSIAGVAAKWELERLTMNDPYIKDFFWDGKNLIVICFFKTQVEVLSRSKTFQVDMGFKRIKDSNIKEVLFATYQPEIEKLFTFLRVFVNQESTRMYYEVFKRVFTLLRDVYHLPIAWNYLSGSGFQAVIMDMDTKQCPGLGMYLASIDERRRPWQEHIKHIVIYCQVHLMRGIQETTSDDDWTPESINQQMLDLVNCQSKEDYEDMCEEFEVRYRDTKLGRWASHKKLQNYACGINKHCSAIPNEIWDDIYRKHSNPVESSHWRGNSTGRWLPFLQAVENSERLDSRDAGQYNAFMDSGVRPGYRPRNMSKRFDQSESQREQKAKRRRGERSSSRNTLGLTVDVASTTNSSPAPASTRSSPVRSSSGGAIRRVRSTSGRRSQSSTPGPTPPSATNAGSSLALRRSISHNILNASINYQLEEIEIQERQAAIREQNARAEELELKNRRERLEIARLERLEREENG